MIQKQTKTSFPILDKRNKIIGNYIIHLKVEDIYFNESNVNVNGYYYYINDNESVVLLDRFNINLSWEQIDNVELSLQPLDTTSLKNTLSQRIEEFTDIQLMLESGENYGTTYDDWE